MGASRRGRLLIAEGLAVGVTVQPLELVLTKVESISVNEGLVACTNEL